MSEDRVARFDLSDLGSDLSSLGSDLSALRKPPEHSDAPFSIARQVVEPALPAVEPGAPAAPFPTVAPDGPTSAPAPPVPPSAPSAPRMPSGATISTDRVDSRWTRAWMARTPVISWGEGRYRDRYLAWREDRDGRPAVPWWGYGYALSGAPLLISLLSPWFVLRSDSADPRAGEQWGMFHLFSLLAVLLVGWVATGWAVKIVTREEFRSMVSSEESEPDPGRWHRMSALSGAAGAIGALFWLLSNAGFSEDEADELRTYTLSPLVGFWFAGLALVIVAGTWLAHRRREDVEQWWTERRRRRTGNPPG